MPHKMEKDYLTRDHLIGFDNYKYSCKDTGILSIYVMHPFWNWIVLVLSEVGGSNLLTFSGFIFTLATFLIFTFLDYYFYASDPDHPEVAPLSEMDVYGRRDIFIFGLHLRWHRWKTSQANWDQQSAGRII
ncbi:hypothetical protein NQ317_000154 [Molorchus minor]|uniref:Uncharacterized protein n=1 Tax=Molorchus minor TaxID=1323400 RepID=A0ABQ9JFR9_9CUCU|nr:hypothetical protein NQ317_000154 [Molorchus minor]